MVSFNLAQIQSFSLLLEGALLLTNNNNNNKKDNLGFTKIKKL